MKKITPEIGEINLGKHNIITSYYEQNQAEALSLEERVIDLICDKSPEWSQKKVRTFLGGFGFQNETVFKYIKQLSGGEKARLALALMIINPSNFLLLDEPTNHLDLQSKENLELAIKNYKGSLLIISHAGTMSALLSYFLDLDLFPWTWRKYLPRHAGHTTLKSSQISSGHFFRLKEFNNVTFLNSEEEKTY